MNHRFENEFNPSDKKSKKKYKKNRYQTDDDFSFKNKTNKSKSRREKINLIRMEEMVEELEMTEV